MPSPFPNPFKNKAIEVLSEHYQLLQFEGIDNVAIEHVLSNILIVSSDAGMERMKKMNDGMAGRKS